MVAISVVLIMAATFFTPKKMEEMHYTFDRLCDVAPSLRDQGIPITIIYEDIPNLTAVIGVAELTSEAEREIFRSVDLIHWRYVSIIQHPYIELL